MKRTTSVLAASLFLSACALLITSCAGNEIQSPQPPVTSLKDNPATVPETNQVAVVAPAAQTHSAKHSAIAVTSGPNYPVDQYTQPASAAAVVAAPAVIAAPAVVQSQPTAPLQQNYMGDGNWWPWLLLLLLLAALGWWIWSRNRRDKDYLPMDTALNNKGTFTVGAALAEQGLLGVDAGLTEKKLLGLDAAGSAGQAILGKHVKKHKALLAKRARAHQSVLAKHARSAHRLKLAKEAELAAQEIAAKHAASAKKGFLAKIARARHRRLLAKKAKAHQAVLAKHARVTHRLNLAKEAEAAAQALSAKHALLTRQAAIAKHARSAHRLKLAREAALAAQEVAAKHAALAKKGILAKIARLRHRRLLAKRRRAYQALLAERAKAHQAVLAKHARSTHRLKLAKEAEAAAQAVVAKHAASEKKGLLAKAAASRHQRLLAKRALAHQAVLAEHDEATHELNLSKEEEGAAPAASTVPVPSTASTMPVASAVPEKHAELLSPRISAKASALGNKTILPTDAGMGHDEILVQGAGLNEVVKVSIRRGATFQEIIVSVARMGNFPAANAHLFLEDEQTPLNPNHRVDAKHPLHKIHHVHTQKEIGVEVHFNGQEHQTNFSPATTVRKVLAWAAHEFKIPDQDGKEVFLSMPDSSQPLQDTAHIGRFVPHDQNKLVLKVMNPTRV